MPTARAQYGSTLDSMGMLEESLGHRDAAKALSLPAHVPMVDCDARVRAEVARKRPAEVGGKHRQGLSEPYRAARARA